GHARNGRSGEMHGHRDAEFLRRVADLFGFEDAARRGEIRVNDIDGVRAAELDKRLLEIDVFAGQDGNVDRVGDLLEQLGILPGNHVFEPGEVVLFERLAQANATVHADVPEVVGR